MRETEKAADILKIFEKEHDCFVFNIAGSYWQRRGMPDSCIIPPEHREIWIEFKGEKSELTALQERTITIMRRKGAKVFVVYFVGPKEWIVNGEYSIKFSNLKEGVSLLYHTLLGISSACS